MAVKDRLPVRLAVGDRLRPGVHVTVGVTLVLGLLEVVVDTVAVAERVVLRLWRDVLVVVRVTVLEGVNEGLVVSDGL